MAIADDSDSGGTPFAKLVNLGDQLIGAWAGAGIRQQHNYDTGKPEWKDDGKPLREEINYFIVMPGTTANSGTADTEYVPLQPGDKVRFSFKGNIWSRGIEAKNSLPAAFGFGEGKRASSDVYLIRLVGWSAKSVNLQREQAAGFTIENGRVVLRSNEERMAYMQFKVNQGGNANPAKDIQVFARRVAPEEKVWEQAADQWFLTKPWESTDEGSGTAGEQEQPGGSPATAPAPEWGGMATDPPVQPVQPQQQRPYGDAWGENSVMKDPAWGGQQPAAQSPPAAAPAGDPWAAQAGPAAPPQTEAPATVQELPPF